MTTGLTPLNQAQRIAEIPINQQTVVQPTTYYTCPSGKKAVIKGSVACYGTGAAASADFRVNGLAVSTWVAVGGIIGNEAGLPTGVKFYFEIEIEAGGTISTTQPVGTNANFLINARILELPA